MTKAAESGIGEVLVVLSPKIEFRKTLFFLIVE